MGRLRYQEYKNFMCSLKYWQSTFKKHTRGTAGILRAEKLRDAIVDVGFQLNTEILSMLMLRYMRKDGTLRFGDFVSCILHLSVAFATFEKKDPLQNGFIKMTLAERASLDQRRVNKPQVSEANVALGAAMLVEVACGESQ
ncbi:hypothetical protein HPB49_021191 [Dermacentor silvarum]|uniref:Uncharacterized protein n=1 Tax=Dermacentor silvarum TaxID=543639 RepID=A0ACB8DG84_DERSI|nr:hypothetical protein HPB49_021191 [Dermacentor silvarum]